MSYIACAPVDPEGQQPKVTRNGSRELHKNTFGAVILSLAKLYDPKKVEEGGLANRWVAFIVAFVFHLMAMGLQVSLIFMMIQFTIERREDKYEGVEPSMTTALWGAISDDKALDKVAFADTLRLCATDHNVPWSQSVMTCLWGMKILPSLWQGIVLSLLTLQLPAPGANKELFEDKNIVCWPTTLKVFLVLVVEIPRIGIAIYLYLMGAKFLMYAPSLGVLIMKSVGLAFIATIPDIILQGVFSEYSQKEIGGHKICYDDGSSKQQTAWNLWGQGVVRFLLVLVTTILYCRVYHGDLQAFRSACHSYEYHFALPTCAPNCGSHLFGFTFYN